MQEDMSRASPPPPPPPDYKHTQEREREKKRRYFSSHNIGNIQVIIIETKIKRRLY